MNAAEQYERAADEFGNRADGKRTPPPADAALALPDQARALTITDADEYVRVAEFVQGIKALRAEIAAGYDEHIKRAHQAHLELVGEKKRRESAAIEAERIAKDLLVAWDTAREAERERERLRLEAIDREVRTEIAIEDAIAAEAAGDVDGAAAILDTPIPASHAAVPLATPKVAGIRYTERWSGRVDNFAALVKAAAADTQLLALLSPNQKAIDTLAKAMQARLAVPGVRAVRTKDVAAGARR